MEDVSSCIQFDMAVQELCRFTPERFVLAEHVYLQNYGCTYMCHGYFVSFILLRIVFRYREKGIYVSGRELKDMVRAAQSDPV